MAKIDKHNNVCEDKVFKGIFKKYSQQLFQFLYFKYQDEDETRDALQQAFIKLWENCKKVTETRAKNYVFTIAKNKIIDNLRKEKKILRIAEDDYVDKDDYNTLSDDISKKQKMERILSKMTESSKEAFLMNRVQGLKYAEIAEELNISIKAVEKRISIALKIIKNELKK